MSGNPHFRHPAIANAERTHILTCGCDSFAAGHAIHHIQARIFSKCPPEKITDIQVEGHEGNHFSIRMNGELRNCWHANPHAVATFVAIATQAEPGHVAHFGESSLLAASNGEVSATLYANIEGQETSCTFKDGEPRPMPKASGPGLIWLN
ncbi:hypothetical protein COCCU_13835 [Corynebacterium occultum]|uniref:Uncharacterized protein n=1 Tax=Corynebacterium occultum TaxID=2675219 RepID=A0A6B8W9L1_9CORY|nr:hypothetical protein [Corynebacterium occultum]QGU08657.1 hypothetical protein COCCU_13835 [Corynebacterium occultum]